MTRPEAKPRRASLHIVASQVAIHRGVGRCRAGAGVRASTSATSAGPSSARLVTPARWSDIDAVAARWYRPAIGSPLVGVSFAKSTVWVLKKPLVPVNHLAGHIESIWLEHGPVPTPAVILVVSGGHQPLSRRESRPLPAARPDP